jgi:hypothetical protein
MSIDMRATEDAAWRRVIAGQAPPGVAGRATYSSPENRTGSPPSG